MATVTKTPKKRRPEPKLSAGRLGLSLGRNLGLIVGLLGLPLVGAGLTYYFMDKFQVQRDFRIRGESAHVMRTNGGNLDVATIGIDKTVRDGPKFRYQNTLTYTVRLPTNLVLEPRPKEHKYVVKIMRPVVIRPATLTAVVTGARSLESDSRDFGATDATYQKLWSAIEHDLHATATQARIDAQAKITLNTFIQNWRTKNLEMGPIEAWPVEVVFE
jgi:hypothetical protein